MTKLDLNFGGSYYRLAIKERLEEKISQILGLEQSQIQLSNGSNGSLRFLFSVLALKYWNDDGHRPSALIDVPNYFDTIKFLKASSYQLNYVERNKDFSFPLTKFVERLLRIKPYLVILTTPNNPTGIALSEIEIDRIITNVPAASIVVIDRTCLNVAPEISTSKLLKKYADVKIIVSESFSKSHNLSAERVSYFVTNNLGLAEYLADFYDDGGVSATAMEKLVAVFDQEEVVQENRAEITRSLNYLSQYERKNPGFLCTQSTSNFILVRLDERMIKKMQESFLFASGLKFGIKEPGVCRLNLSSSDRVKEFISKYDTCKKIL